MFPLFLVPLFICSIFDIRYSIPDLHFHYPRIHHIDFFSSGAGKVNNAPAHKRAPVVDLHANGPPVPFVHDVHDRPERQRAVCGGDLLGPERLARSRRQTVEFLPIPGREPLLAATRSGGCLGGGLRGTGC